MLLEFVGHVKYEMETLGSCWLQLRVLHPSAGRTHAPHKEHTPRQSVHQGIFSGLDSNVSRKWPKISTRQPAHDCLDCLALEATCHRVVQHLSIATKSIFENGINGFMHRLARHLLFSFLLIQSWCQLLIWLPPLALASLTCGFK